MHFLDQPSKTVDLDDCISSLAPSDIVESDSARADTPTVYIYEVTRPLLFSAQTEDTVFLWRVPCAAYVRRLPAVVV